MPATVSPEPPIPGMQTVPFGWPLMAAEWLGCVQWALSDPGVRERFQNATGCDLDAIANATGMARLIDESTGRTLEALAAFADYVTRTHWGEEAP